MFYIFHGEDEFSRVEALVDLKSKMGDPAWLDLNTTVLDARKLMLSELIHACDAVPFLGEHRLVIVEGLLASFDQRSRREEKAGEADDSATETDKAEVVTDTSRADGLVTYLPRLPETTWLVFVEPRMLKPANPVLRYAEKAGKTQAHVRAFSPPKQHDLNDWIRRRVIAKGGHIKPPAIELLATYLGNDLRLIDMELDKLLTFVGEDQPITEGAVRQLVTAIQESSVFDLVDALGLRDRRRAMALLVEMLDAGQPPAYLMIMIVRQVRILLQLKELSTEHLNLEQIKKQTGLHSFVVNKCLRQAHNFSLEALESIYGRLVELDTAMKTGQISSTLGLELLVAELCSIPASQVKSW
jgi:DNA polymerase III subunit delta